MRQAKRRKEMNEYTHMVVRKISGRVVSRHKSEDAAFKAVIRGNSEIDPLEVQKYSDGYYRQMK